jgi:uncharacterized protein
MKNLIILVALVLSAFIANGQNITGKWNGKLNLRGKQLNIAFNISKASGGGYKSTLDSPDQKVFGMATTATKLKDSILTIQIENAGIEFVGTMNAAGKFVGLMKQSGELFPLELQDSKTAKKIAANSEKQDILSLSGCSNPEILTQTKRRK